MLLLKESLAFVLSNPSVEGLLSLLFDAVFLFIVIIEVLQNASANLTYPRLHPGRLHVFVAAT